MDLEYLYFLFKVGTLFIIIFGFTYLLVLSVIVRDTDMIVGKPFIFVVEILAMSVLPGLPLLFFVMSRGITWKSAWIWFASLSIKFGIFHVLMELSGTYRWLFS